MVNSMLSYSGLSDGFWGEAMAIVRLSDPKRKTLGEKSIDCIFVGYVEHSKAYRFYVIEPNDFMSINTIIESRDAIFDENRFSSIPRPMDIIPNSDKSQRDDHSNNVPNAAFWKEAIDDEIGYYYRIIITGFIDLPLSANGSSKGDESDGKLNKFKARFGYSRLLLALAAIHNLVIHQMDVKTTFLNGNVEEEVYMKQPKGFVMVVIMEYLVNISKRRAFWSLNDDILKITILNTNTPYPSRKIRCIHACTHQRPQRKEAQYAVSRRPIRRIGNME
ncbi:zinc finger, CCHC-type containing protein [Tanacetum coccineum]